ncbi:MAG TPA: ribonuclease HII [Candidatus Methylomirabilis sp.]|nr:ribonuclease HII [Candidatus Methylomirabilis sp.]
MRTIAGVDEVGRGALAGPVVAAAVLIPVDQDLAVAADSKVLSPEARLAALPVIEGVAAGIGVGVVEAEEIDALNILRATFRAMAAAVAALPRLPDLILVDGTLAPPLPLPCRPIPRGDALIPVIGAASIVAKVRRDAIMAALDCAHPRYGFSRHKGYGTAAHRAAVAAFGVCPVHRRSFAGIREHLPGGQPPLPLGG